MLYVCLMCPAWDVTAEVREGQQYTEPGRVPHTEIYVAPCKEESDIGQLLLYS